MLQFTCIGNLGNDAQVKVYNGSKFVAFDVAHTDSWKDESGVVHENTIWVSCTLNGDGGNLLPYLTKGRKVFVSGQGSVRCYSSAVQRKMMAGANINVRTIELLGGPSDEVPSRVIASTGEILPTNKAYFVDEKKAQALCGNADSVEVTSANGSFFQLLKTGWVLPAQNVESNNAEASK